MKNPLISVIVPVYKVEAYLEKCVESVRNQTYKNLEIILVDDGSPDSCGQICDSLAKKDGRIRVLHKENGGLSSARNAGIKAATGELIGFVDSDDWIEPEMYEVLCRNLLATESDISICGMYGGFYKNRENEKEEELYNYKTVTPHEAIRMAMEFGGYVDMFAWNKLYKKHIFSQICFPEGKLYEDTYILVEILDLAKQLVCSSAPLYHYVYRGDSITKSGYKPGEMHLIEGVDRRLAYLTSHYPDLSKIALERSLASYFEVLDKMMHSEVPVESTDKKKVVRYLRKHIVDILRHSRFSISRKMAALSLCISIRLYTKLLNYKSDC